MKYIGKSMVSKERQLKEEHVYVGKFFSYFLTKILFVSRTKLISRIVFRKLEFTLLVSLLAISACTPPISASIQETPILLNDGGLGYIYQGRANTAGQRSYADEAMRKHCHSIGYRYALMVEQKFDNLGKIKIYQHSISNRDQRILFKCVN